MQPVFSYDSYISYLTEDIQSQGKRRGYQASLAGVAGCAPPYLSAVLAAKAHLLPDHAHNLCQHWQFDSGETEFFMTLVQLERASKKQYRRYLLKKIDELRAERESLATRAKGQNLNHQDAAAYYKHWSIAAVHVLTAVPAFRQIPAIARALQLSKAQVHSCLKLLVKLGLVDQLDDTFVRSTRNLHLPADSPYIAAHHLNWRSKMIADGFYTPSNQAKDLHYTAVFAVSRKDSERIRQMTLAYFDELQRIVKDSSEETVAAICLDLAPLATVDP